MHVRAASLGCWRSVVIVVSGALMALIGGDDSSQQSPVPVPTSAESARADALRAQFPGGDRVPAIVVVSRRDGDALTPADLGRDPAAVRCRCPTTVAPRWPRCRWTRSVRVRAQRCGQGAARLGHRDGPPDDLRVEVTGGPAFGADIANSFSGANITLLAVTASVVALLLIVTYRSPVLWLVPLAVIGVRRSGRRCGRQCDRRSGGHDARRFDVRHHQRAGIRGRHQLRAAADLALPRGIGPHRESP